MEIKFGVVSANDDDNDDMLLAVGQPQSHMTTTIIIFKAKFIISNQQHETEINTYNFCFAQSIKMLLVERRRMRAKRRAKLFACLGKLKAEVKESFKEIWFDFVRLTP